MKSPARGHLAGQPGLEARESGSGAQAQNHCASLLSDATEGSSKMKTEKLCRFRSMEVISSLGAVSWSRTSVG